MNITSTTIKAYTVTWPEPELRALVKELAYDSAFYGPLTAALDDVPVPAKAPRRKVAKGKVADLRKQAKAIGRSTASGKPAKAKRACPVCGKQIAYLAIHLKTKHPEYTPSV